MSNSKGSTSEFKKGDKVQWNSLQGTIEGVVVKKLTSDMQIKDHHVKASEDDPQYLVKSDKTGAEAAHKPDALTLLDDD
ncbi:unnamed protein product [Adineta steineri]|uniref:Hypervirulence associated protein TUDOR domain-containing protein n=1 Tax=Adineta steineri TaxID=433720 RepID=A0A818HQV6_9BILA|nr:unnamed protein product [Adineta steineri]CAF0777397.1 unnamed protein product [Adineta steineri]CAF0792726.1 unnamed protein product [Adineta steineri]CAF0796899.1 unnamed protein product [Adineta steineri]CAF0840178.1 unnamed protein product [Adineta steineri]